MPESATEERASGAVGFPTEGDVVATEPVVRYIREVLDPKADVVIKSAWKEVFSHLEDAKTVLLGPNERMPDTGFLKLILWPEPPIANFNLMPPVDYASLAAFRGLMILSKSPQLRKGGMSVMRLNPLNKAMIGALQDCLLSATPR